MTPTPKGLLAPEQEAAAHMRELAQQFEIERELTDDAEQRRAWGDTVAFLVNAAGKLENKDAT